MSTTNRQLRKREYSSCGLNRKAHHRAIRTESTCNVQGAELNIIGLLNGKPSGATERVSWIVEACQQIIQLHESMRLSHASHSSAPALDNHPLLADTGRILKELKTRLAKYKCLPVVSYFAFLYTCFYVQYIYLRRVNTRHLSV